MKLTFFIICVVFVTGCQSFTKNTQSPSPSADDKPSTASVELAWGKHRAEWSKFLVEKFSQSSALSVDLKDADDWCPKYNSLDKSDRALVLSQLVSIMAKRESGFNPASKYTEAFNDSKGRPVISRGLLQISIESANSYGCNFKDAQELHDPTKNLACGIKIIERWLERDHRLGGKVAGKWQGCARYWSVCRAVSRSYPVVTSFTKALSVCD